MSEPRLLVVNSHFVRPRDKCRYPGLHIRTPEEFSCQLDALSARSSFLAPEDLYEWLVESRRLPGGDYFALTFDDGLVDQLQFIAPEVERRAWRVFFFVNTEPWQGHLLGVHRLQLLMAATPFQELYSEFAAFAAAEGASAQFRPDAVSERTVRAQYRYDDLPVARFKFTLNFELETALRERIVSQVFEKMLGGDTEHLKNLYLAPEHVRQLADRGHTIGLHSHRHSPLARLAPDQLLGDLGENMAALSHATGHTPWAISYPYGGQDATSPAVAEVCRNLGLRLGFTMNRGYVEGKPDPLLLNRVDTNDALGGKAPKFSFEEDL